MDLFASSVVCLASNPELDVQLHELNCVSNRQGYFHKVCKPSVSIVRLEMAWVDFFRMFGLAFVLFTVAITAAMQRDFHRSRRSVVRELQWRRGWRRCRETWR
jgi:hypothetical protein